MSSVQLTKEAVLAAAERARTWDTRAGFDWHDAPVTNDARLLSDLIHKRVPQESG